MNEIKWQEVKERSRAYHYPSGSGGEFSVVFENVVRIEVRESGKHRLETASGQKAFVAPGWLWLDIDADAWTF